MNDSQLLYSAIEHHVVPACQYDIDRMKRAVDGHADAAKSGSWNRPLALNLQAMALIVVAGEMPSSIIISDDQAKIIDILNQGKTNLRIATSPDPAIGKIYNACYTAGYTLPACSTS